METHISLTQQSPFGERERQRRESEREIGRRGINGETGMSEIGWRERKREQREIDW